MGKALASILGTVGKDEEEEEEEMEEKKIKTK